jgi:hypothetical protein
VTDAGKPLQGHVENILKLAPDVASILSSATKLGELIKG